MKFNPFSNRNKDMTSTDQDPIGEDAAAEEMETMQPEVVDINQEYVNRLARLQADFDNYRRRNATAAQTARDEARKETFAQLLPVYDNFLRAVEHATDSVDIATIREGMDAIRRQMESVFTQQGLELVDATPGSPFDPEMHEAAGTQLGGDDQQSLIAEELQKGFTYRGQVIRPAQVIVYSE